MKLENDEIDAETPELDAQARYPGWPELAGAVGTALIVWFMFAFANGHY